MSKNEKYKYAKILSFNTLCSPREILISIPYGVNEKDCRIIVSYSDGRQEIIFPECFKTFEVDYLNAFYNIIEMGIPVNNAMYSYIAFGFPEKALGVFKLLDTLYPGFDENGMPIVFQTFPPSYFQTRRPNLFLVSLSAFPNDVSLLRYTGRCNTPSSTPSYFSYCFQALGSASFL